MEEKKWIVEEAYGKKEEEVGRGTEEQKKEEIKTEIRRQTKTEENE